MTQSGAGNEDFNLALASMVGGLIGLADAYVDAAKDRGLPDAGSPGMRDIANQDRFAKLPGAQPVDNAQPLMRITTFAGFDHLRSYVAPVPRGRHSSLQSSGYRRARLSRRSGLPHGWPNPGWQPNNASKGLSFSIWRTLSTGSGTG
jgi:hypothetical protein